MTWFSRLFPRRRPLHELPTEAVDTRIAERLQLLSAASDIGTLSDEVKGLLADSRRAAQDVQAALGVFRDSEALLDLQMLPTRLRAIQDEAKAAQVEIATLRGVVAKVQEENAAMRAAAEIQSSYEHAVWSTCVLPAGTPHPGNSRLFGYVAGDCVPGTPVCATEADTNMRIRSQLCYPGDFAVQAIGYRVTGGPSDWTEDAPWLGIPLQGEIDVSTLFDIPLLSMFRSVRNARQGIWVYPPSRTPVIPSGFGSFAVQARADLVPALRYLSADLRLTVTLYGREIPRDLTHYQRSPGERSFQGFFRDLS